ncbi:MAG: hypothetical protein AB1791_02955 [Chloroflexota bacterium]
MSESASSSSDLSAQKAGRGIVWRGGLYTALFLVVGLVIGFFAGAGLEGSLPRHTPATTRQVLAAVPVLLILVAASALWGRQMARLTGSAATRRMAWAGVLSYAPAVILVGFGLTLLEVALVEEGRGPDWPIHVVYTLLFTPAAFLIAGLGGLALGLANRSGRLAGRLFLFVGLAGGLAFLAVDLVMDALGWRVGAPGAVARVTMLTVTLVGDLAAALVSGTVLATLLSRHVRQGQPQIERGVTTQPETRFFSGQPS